MARIPWSHQSNELQRHRQKRFGRKVRSKAPFGVIAFLFGALAAGYYFKPLDLPRILQPSVAILHPGQGPARAYPQFGMCRSSSQSDCIVDGDTFRLGAERMRIANIDAPETHTNICGGAKEVALGRQASTRLQSLMNSAPVEIHRVGLDRYGRTLVRVRAGSGDVGDMLISERLARRWPDGPEWWCH